MSKNATHTNVNPKKGKLRGDPSLARDMIQLMTVLQQEMI
mgnify:FL=1